ncbi:MAG: hypothetical protein KIH63_000220 [Candidatus Saccharibacteria bacterium]|nr:hypothetical protein [Candidatus Saccharibacteria bacterium]
MTQDAVDFDRIREQFMSYEFQIVPSEVETEELHQRWADARGHWIDTMLDPTAAEGLEANFYSEQVDATGHAFEQSMSIQAECFRLHRDESTELSAFNAAWRNYFPDELYVNIRRLPQAFHALVVQPSVHVRDYQLAMGRVMQASYGVING